MGRRHLEQAIASTGVKCDVQWLPYLLSPRTPPEGEDLREYLAAKYGSHVAQQIGDPGNPLQVAGRKLGITFDTSRRFINTISAHCVVEHVRSIDSVKADALMEAMFHAYFEKAKDLSKEKELQEVVNDIGMSSIVVKDIIGSQINRDAILTSDQEVKSKLRVSGVPFFMIEPLSGGRPIAFSGAQPSEIIAEQLLEAADD